MNLAKLGGRIEQELTSLTPALRLARMSIWMYRGLDLLERRVGETHKLEARIADDFKDLPEDVAQQFWADTLNERSE